MTVFGNSLLERGEGRMWRCLETECWREEKVGSNGVWEQSADGR